MTISGNESADPLAVLADALSGLPADTGQLASAQACLNDMAASAREAGRADVARFASSIHGLLELLQTQVGDADTGVDEIAQFVRDAVAPLRAALDDDDGATRRIQDALETVDRRWGEYLALMAPTSGDAENEIWTNALDAAAPDHWSDDAGDPPADTSRKNIEEMLACLTTGSSSAAEPTSTKSRKSDTVGGTPSSGRKSEMFGKTSGSLPDEPPLPVNIEMDADLLEAFGEDAGAGVARLEQILLELENRPDDQSLHQSVCRELHTLKGASASVGLTDFADYLHRVEDYVESAKGKAIEIAPMLKCVDAVRRQLEVLNGGADSTTPGDGAAESSAKAPTSSFEPTAGREESLRVKASRVDRLMDLLAELVILRNQRESRLSRLKHLHSELTRCVTRLHVFSNSFDLGLPVVGVVEAGLTTNEDGMPSERASSSVIEIANDVTEFARSLRDLAEPMEAENVTISQFIRQFRSELMEMRRAPVSGLFQRLNRAARDAARIEEKKIDFRLLGEHAGLDRSLQERLYEPLLHMVRNSVSHGVETPSERRKAGKPETGTITLSAKGSATTLVIEITDDGRGLDYEAIRRRGLDRGLISVGESLEESRLAKLIFHPGFSTRTETNAVAGRGVGMDVVAAALQRMRAKIDVESRPGAGTTMRLTIPLRSVIEHAMVVRASGRLYAIPMQFVQAAGPVQRDDKSRMVRLRLILGETDSPAGVQEHVVRLGSGRLSFSNAASGKRSPDDSQGDSALALIVDEVIGPDEVVVRSLPSLLKSNPYLGGVTLSGAGEIVQLLDGQRLLNAAEQCSQTRAAGETSERKTGAPAKAISKADATKVLVVDDSLSARRRLVKMLRGAGFQITEASDGREALDAFRSEEFQVVFTDIEMPNVDGFGVLSEIKSGPRGNATPVVVASSRAESQFRDQAAELGADDYLVKPVTATALAETLLKLESRFISKLEN